MRRTRPFPPKSCKVCNKFYLPKNEWAEYYGQTCSRECLHKIKRQQGLRLQKLGFGFKKGNNLGRRGKERNPLWYKENQMAIEEEGELLKQQGFSVLYVDKLRPDIIARKDNKIYAVEVESGVEIPRYDKYSTPTIFDDVIWIRRKGNTRFRLN